MAGRVYRKLRAAGARQVRASRRASVLRGVGWGGVGVRVFVARLTLSHVSRQWQVAFTASRGQQVRASRHAFVFEEGVERGGGVSVLVRA